MKYASLIAVALLLASCKSEEERKAEWITMCVNGEFTQKQCNVLYSIVKNSNDNASDNAALTGIAIGMSAGRR